MADSNSKSRTSLKNRFEAGDIPEERHFRELIHSCFNQIDDGIKKEAGSPLKIQAPINQNGTIKEVLQFYDVFDGAEADWRIGLAFPSGNISKEGLSISESEQIDGIKFFIQKGGNIGIGTTNPGANLDVNGTIKATTFKGFMQPDNGDSGEAGILFPSISGNNPGANIRYFSRGNSGDGRNLKINVSESQNNHIILMASGNVGIKTNTPTAELDVNGNIALSEDIRMSALKKLHFLNNDNDDNNHLKIQLRTNFGMGVNISELFYKADEAYSWKDKDNEERMRLTNDASGKLEVKGTGVSSFAGDLQIKGTGVSSFAGNLNIGKKIIVDESIATKSDIELPEAKQLKFTGNGISNGLKIQLRTNFGIGIESGVQFYKADGQHSWRDKDNTERMVLDTKSTGGLTLKGTGSSTFAGTLNIKGTGSSTFANNLKVGKKLEIGGNLKLVGNMELTGRKQILFSNSDDNDEHFKIQLRERFGIGIQNEVLFYTANGNHSWRDKDNTERMVLDTTLNGGLTVRGRGQSSFAGNLTVSGKGTSSFGGDLSVGKQLKVTGKVTASSFESTGVVKGSKLKSGNAEISNNSLTIGRTTINEAALKVLKKLIAGTLEVKIVSKDGNVLESRKGRVDDGDAMRTLQFNTHSGNIIQKMKIVLW